MTQGEVLELNRLEVNISRLGDIVTRQGARIAELETELRLRDEELDRLRTELQEACKQSSMSSLARSLMKGSTEEELGQAKQVLDGIITEVECCIQQLAEE